MSYFMGHGPDILAFLKAFGIDDNDMMDATIKMKAGDIVTIETRSILKTPKLNEIHSIMRKYRLELIEEKSDAPSPLPVFGPCIVLGDDFGRGI